VPPELGNIIERHEIELASASHSLDHPSDSADAAIERFRGILNRATKRGISLKNTFLALDANGDGFLSIDEFDHALSDLGFSNLTHKDFIKFVCTIDNDQDARVNYKEFVKFVHGTSNAAAVPKTNNSSVEYALKLLWSRARARGQSISSIWDTCDINHDGNVSHDEFMKVFADLDLDSRAQGGGISAYLEHNGVMKGTDGINKVEFIALVCRVCGEPVPEKNAVEDIAAPGAARQPDTAPPGLPQYDAAKLTAIVKAAEEVGSAGAGAKNKIAGRMAVLKLLQSAVGDSGVSVSIVECAAALLAGGAATWLDPDQIRSFEPVVLERAQLLALVRRCGSTFNSKHEAADAHNGAHNGRRKTGMVVMVDKVTTEEVSKAAQLLLHGSAAWLGEDTQTWQWKQEIQSRQSDLKWVRAAIEPSMIPAATVVAANHPMQRVRAWLNAAEEKDWAAKIRQHMSVLPVCKQAMAQDGVTLKALHAANVLLRNPAETGWLTEAPTWRVTVETRLRDVEMVQKAAKVGTNAVPAAAVAQAEAVRDAGKLAYLAGDDVVDECCAEVLHRAITVFRLQLALGKSLQEVLGKEGAGKAGSGGVQLVHAKMVLDACMAIDERQVSWLSEEREWTKLLEVRRGLVERLSASTQPYGVNVAMIEGRVPEARGARVWLAESEAWEALLTERSAQVKIIQRAVSDANVLRAEEIIAAQAPFEKAQHWVAEAETKVWRMKLKTRMDVVRSAQECMGEGVDPDRVGPVAKEVQSAGAEGWLSEANSWYAILAKRDNELSILRAACDDHEVQLPTLDHAQQLILTGDINWMKTSEVSKLTKVVQRRHAYVATVRAAVGLTFDVKTRKSVRLLETTPSSKPDSNTAQVRSSMIEQAAILLFGDELLGQAPALKWLDGAEPGRWREQLRGRLDMVNTLKQAATAGPKEAGGSGVKTTMAQLESAALDVGAAAVWLVEAREWRTVLAERLEGAKRLERAAEGQHVVATEVEAAHSEVGVIEGWLVEAAACRGFLAERVEAIYLVRDQGLANGSKLSYATVLRAAEAAHGMMHWLVDGPSWLYQLQRRVDSVKTIQAALRPSGVRSAEVDMAASACRDAEGWLADANEWGEQVHARSVTVNRLRAASHAKHTVPAAVVEAAAQEEADGETSWLADEAWTREVHKRIRVIRLLRAAVLTDAVAEESAVRRAARCLGLNIREKEVSTAAHLVMTIPADDIDEDLCVLERAKRKSKMAKLALIEEGKLATKRKQAESEAHLDAEAAEAQGVGVECWLLEGDSWRKTVRHRLAVLTLLDRALQPDGVCYQAVVDARELILQREPWLAAAQNDQICGTIGTRYMQASQVHAAVGDSRTFDARSADAATLLPDVTAAAVEEALAIVAGDASASSLCTWLQQGPSWAQEVAYRCRVVRVLKEALEPTNVSAPQVEQAHRLVITARTWLHEAVGWADELVAREELVRLMRGAMSGSVRAEHLEEAEAALRLAGGWLDLDSTMFNEEEAAAAMDSASTQSHVASADDRCVRVW
jgi:Ca2+-binding EF-hand superfamily protein